ncbi:ABC transporter permease [Micromonospora sp. CA-259024]|uniref:ABC transporter permease n=1 Tax=Micromonospora sp. CA-259024 TaxID=3239965 RepID=UPI003D93A65E
MLVGVVVRQTARVQSVVLLLMFPPAFGTTMVTPAETLPGWLRAWADVNPVTHAIAASRGLLLGGPVAEEALYCVLWSAGILAVFAPLAVWAYRRRT